MGSLPQTKRGPNQLKKRRKHKHLALSYDQISLKQYSFNSGVCCSELRIQKQVKMYTNLFQHSNYSFQVSHGVFCFHFRVFQHEQVAACSHSVIHVPKKVGKKNKGFKGENEKKLAEFLDIFERNCGCNSPMQLFF